MTPTERDIDWLDNLQVEFLHGVPVYLPKEAKQAIGAHYEKLMLDIIGEDENSKHVKRYQCPNYGDGCYSWEEYYKSNQDMYCRVDGRKLKVVKFDEQDGDDWVRNELRAELRANLREKLK